AAIMKKATMQEMMDQQVPIHARDDCANVLIPLNKCRRGNMYSPFACEHEKHSYEICLYKEYEKRRE
ncbi:B18 subunit of NADH:ubiquinone oxidoreductase, partial [Ochromonadaceae sp. CCMP2298]